MDKAGGMKMPPLMLNSCPWLDAVFRTKAAQSGDIARRSVRDTEREIGRDAFGAAVRQWRFHLVKCGGQPVAVCNPCPLQVIC